MNGNLALGLLSDLMGWSDERSRDEFEWLRLMSRLKYDGYRDFCAGMRFVESFANWIQQFQSPDERNIAYRFVRERLVYLGPAEMGHLVELLYPNHVRPRLGLAIAAKKDVPLYRVWTQPDSKSEFELLRRRTLFMSLSDGAHLDLFRRANSGVISNEQVVGGIQISDDKWRDLLANLRADLNDEGALFACVYVVDDFAGTGKTLIRKSDDQWKGKLKRFRESSAEHLPTHFEEDWTLCVHHHVATHEAKLKMVEREAAARSALGKANWFPRVEFSFGMVLPEAWPITRETDAPFWDLTEKYYDEAVESKHTAVGGTDMRRGFGGCGLPLVLEHNTPNNSVGLLWAETDGKTGHPMRPLFRRRDRHVDE